MKTFISSISAHIWLKKMVGIWFSSQCGHYYEARLEKSLVSTFSICPPAPSSGKYEALEGNLLQALLEYDEFGPDLCCNFSLP